MFTSLFLPTTETCALASLYRILAIFTVAAGLIWGRSILSGGSRGEALRKRYFTFAVLAAVALIPAYFGGISFALIVGALVLCSIVEFFQMLKLDDATAFRNLAIVLAVATISRALTFVSVPIHFAIGAPATMIPLLYLMPVLTIFASVLLPVFRQKTGTVFTGTCYTTFSVIYFAWFLSHLLLIRSLDNGFGYITFLGMCVGVNDTAALAFGKLFGKTKMSPVISPNKTWEGFIGGTVGTIVTALFFQHTLTGISAVHFAILTLAIIVAAPLGDLVLSAAKREFNIKDCGSSLPGHGGVLDRFDSMILAAPIFYYVLTLSL